MRTKRISEIEVEYTAFSLARKMLTWDEPIPDFGTRFPNILESCLGTPFGQFNRKDLYRGLVGKGSILFYLMIKNHPFQNGNKRIAIMSLLYFFYKNDKWLRIDNINLYNFAKDVAKSKPKSRDKVISHIQETLSRHLVSVTINV
jgi:death on curing protein